MYPNLPVDYVLARYRFTGVDGTGHAFIICGHHAPGFAGTAQTMANTLFTDYKNNAFVNISNQAQFDDVSVVWNAAGVLTEATSNVAPQVGGDTNPPISPQVAAIVKKQSATIGKHNRGRIYVPFIGDDKFDGAGGFLSTGAQTALQTAFSAWLAQLTTDALSLVILHRNPSLVPVNVVSLLVESQVGTQRRRNRKAAHH